MNFAFFLLAQLMLSCLSSRFIYRGNIVPVDHATSHWLHVGSLLEGMAHKLLEGTAHKLLEGTAHKLLEGTAHKSRKLYIELQPECRVIFGHVVLGPTGYQSTCKCPLLDCFK